MRRRRYTVIEAELGNVKPKKGIRRLLPERQYMTREKYEVPGDRFSSIMDYIRFKMDELFSIKVP